MKKLCAAVLMLFFILGTLQSAQKVTLKGRVTDAEGNPLSGVKVEIYKTKFQTTTSKEGTFSIKGLNPGKYRLIITHPDYMPGVLEVNVKESREFIKIDLSKKSPHLLTLKEEVTVTAEADSIIDVSLPSHRTIFTDKVLSELGTSNIAESVKKSAGVSMVGKGGYSMVPAIRGLAEHRILLLMDGVRIRSERRIGASASFVNVNNVERIELNRGPYSVFYGSGAIGGIINIITKSPSPQTPFGGKLDLSYNTARKEKAGSFSLKGSQGKFGFMLSVTGKKAQDYSSPQGVVEQSHYSDYDYMVKVNRKGENSRFHMTFFDYYGINMGKPSPTSKYRPRWYPKERNTIFNVGYQRDNLFSLDQFNASFYVFPNMLKTKKENLDHSFNVEKRNLAKVEGTSFGIKIRGNESLGETHTFNFGIDYFGRRDMNDRNTAWRCDEAGRWIGPTEETSLRDARRDNLGLYLDDKIQVSSAASLNIGARFDFIRTSNEAYKEGNPRSDQEWTAYIGSTFQLTPHFSLLANLGRAFRFPTISELFYSGLTGRGTVFGNPDLEPEKSLNMDVGVRYLQGKYYGSLYFFRNSVNDMIRKYRKEGTDEYFYKNLAEGYIQGLEGEFYFWLVENLEIFFSFHHMRGKETTTDQPLNYIPPTRLNLRPKYSLGDFWMEPRVILQAPKENPGPLEIDIDGYTLLDTVVGYRLNQNVSLLAIGKNLLNQTYRFSADEKGVAAPGRSLVIKALFSF
ncbi:TonB-dependent receptor [bacterium]|nr:TonB-dependent receptor [bacterium]